MCASSCVNPLTRKRPCIVPDRSYLRGRQVALHEKGAVQDRRPYHPPHTCTLSRAQPCGREGPGSCDTHSCTQQRGRGSSWASAGTPPPQPSKGRSDRENEIRGSTRWQFWAPLLQWPPLTHRHLIIHVLLVKVKMPARLPKVQLGNVRRVHQVVTPLWRYSSKG
jgi:hypothetical protein